MSHKPFELGFVWSPRKLRRSKNICKPKLCQAAKLKPWQQQSMPLFRKPKTPLIHVVFFGDVHRPFAAKPKQLDVDRLFPAMWIGCQLEQSP